MSFYVTEKNARFDLPGRVSRQEKIGKSNDVYENKRLKIGQGDNSNDVDEK